MGTVKNGVVFWRWVSGVLVTLLLASGIWIANVAGEAASVKKDVEANTLLAEENKKDIHEDVNPTVSANKEAIIGIGKDIEQLQVEVGELKTTTNQMITEQRNAFQSVLDRLPK